MKTKADVKDVQKRVVRMVENLRVHLVVWNLLCGVELLESAFKIYEAAKKDILEGFLFESNPGKLLSPYRILRANELARKEFFARAAVMQGPVNDMLSEMDDEMIRRHLCAGVKVYQDAEDIMHDSKLKILRSVRFREAPETIEKGFIASVNDGERNRFFDKKNKRNEVVLDDEMFAIIPDDTAMTLDEESVTRSFLEALDRLHEENPKLAVAVYTYIYGMQLKRAVAFAGLDAVKGIEEVKGALIRIFSEMHQVDGVENLKRIAKEAGMPEKSINRRLAKCNYRVSGTD